MLLNRRAPSRRSARVVARFLFGALAAVVLAQCTAPTTGAPVSSLAEIAGPWDIVEFGGYQPRRLDDDGNRHAFVDISNGGLSFTIECNYSGMPARIDEDGRLKALSGDTPQTAIGCGETRERRDQLFFAFFRAEPAILRQPDGGLLFETGDTRLLLQRPEIVRQAALPTELDAIQGRWTTDIIYHRTAPGSSRNLLAPLEGGAATIVIQQNVIRLAVDCIDVEAQGRLAQAGELSSTVVAERRRPGARCLIPETDRRLASSLVSGDLSVEFIDAERLHLIAGDVRAVLLRSLR